MISETSSKPEGGTTKTSRPATPTGTPKTMRMLSAAQAKNPMKHAFYGGFRNIAFQVGVVHQVPGGEPNQIYLRTNKNAKNPLPLLLPNGVRPPAQGTMTKVTCSVVGSIDRHGNPYPQLIARFFETPNVFEASTRRTTELLKTAADPSEMLKKQTGNNNEVLLTGIVVGRKAARRQRADGSMEDNPSVTFLLRQDADPTHVVPVICDKKLAENANKIIRFGDIISVKGQFHTSTVPVIKFDASGQPERDGNGAYVNELNEDGSIKTRFHPYIYLTSYPGVALDEHLLFSDVEQMDVPEWIIEQINKEIEMRSALGRQQNAPAPIAEVTFTAPAAVTAEEYASKADLGAGL